MSAWLKRSLKRGGADVQVEAARKELEAKFEEQKPDIVGKLLSDEVVTLQPKITKVYKSSSAEAQAFMREPTEDAAKANPDMVAHLLEALAAQGVPGMDLFESSATAHGVAATIGGPLVSLFTTVSMLVDPTLSREGSMQFQDARADLSRASSFADASDTALGPAGGSSPRMVGGAVRSDSTDALKVLEKLGEEELHKGSLVPAGEAEEVTPNKAAQSPASSFAATLPSLSAENEAGGSSTVVDSPGYASASSSPAVRGDATSPYYSAPSAVKEQGEEALEDVDESPLEDLIAMGEASLADTDEQTAEMEALLQDKEADSASLPPTPLPKKTRSESKAALARALEAEMRHVESEDSQMEESGASLIEGEEASGWSASSRPSEDASPAAEKAFASESAGSAKEEALAALSANDSALKQAAEVSTDKEVPSRDLSSSSSLASALPSQASVDAAFTSTAGKVAEELGGTNTGSRGLEPTNEEAPAGLSEEGLKAAAGQMGVVEDRVDTGLAVLGQKPASESATVPEKAAGLAAVAGAAAVAAGQAAAAAVKQGLGLTEPAPATQEEAAAVAKDTLVSAASVDEAPLNAVADKLGVSSETVATGLVTLGLKPASPGTEQVPLSTKALGVGTVVGAAAVAATGAATAKVGEALGLTKSEETAPKDQIETAALAKDMLVSASPAGANEVALKDAAQKLGVHESKVDSGLAVLGSKPAKSVDQATLKDKAVGLHAVAGAATLAVGGAVSTALGLGGTKEGPSGHSNGGAPIATKVLPDEAAIKAAAEKVGVSQAAVDTGLQTLGLKEGTESVPVKDKVLGLGAVIGASARAAVGAALGLDDPQAQEKLEQARNADAETLQTVAAKAGVSETAVDTGLSALGYKKASPDTQAANEETAAKAEDALKQAATKIGVSNTTVETGLATLGLKSARPEATQTDASSKAAGVSAVAGAAAVAAGGAAVAAVGSMLGLGKNETTVSPGGVEASGDASLSAPEGQKAAVPSSALVDKAKEVAEKVGLSKEAVDTGLETLGLQEPKKSTLEVSMAEKAAGVAGAAGAAVTAAAIAAKDTVVSATEPATGSVGAEPGTSQLSEAGLPEESPVVELAKAKEAAMGSAPNPGKVAETTTREEGPAVALAVASKEAPNAPLLNTTKSTAERPAVLPSKGVLTEAGAKPSGSGEAVDTQVEAGELNKGDKKAVGMTSLAMATGAGALAAGAGAVASGTIAVANTLGLKKPDEVALTGEAALNQGAGALGVSSSVVDSGLSAPGSKVAETEPREGDSVVALALASKEAPNAPLLNTSEKGTGEKAAMLPSKGVSTDAGAKPSGEGEAVDTRLETAEPSKGDRKADGMASLATATGAGALAAGAGAVASGAIAAANTLGLKKTDEGTLPGEAALKQGEGALGVSSSADDSGLSSLGFNSKTSEEQSAASESASKTLRIGGTAVPVNDETIKKAAAEMGVSAETIDSGLAALGLTPKAEMGLLPSSAVVTAGQAPAVSESALRDTAAKMGLSSDVVNAGLSALGIQTKGETEREGALGGLELGAAALAVGAAGAGVVGEDKEKEAGHLGLGAKAKPEEEAEGSLPAKKARASSDGEELGWKGSFTPAAADIKTGTGSSEKSPAEAGGFKTAAVMHASPSAVANVVKAGESPDADITKLGPSPVKTGSSKAAPDVGLRSPSGRPINRADSGVLPENKKEKPLEVLAVLEETEPVDEIAPLGLKEKPLETMPPLEEVASVEEAAEAEDKAQEEARIEDVTAKEADLTVKGVDVTGKEELVKAETGSPKPAASPGMSPSKKKGFFGRMFSRGKQDAVPEEPVELKLDEGKLEEAPAGKAEDVTAGKVEELPVGTEAQAVPAAARQLLTGNEPTKEAAEVDVTEPSPVARLSEVATPGAPPAVTPGKPGPEQAPAVEQSQEAPPPQDQSEAAAVVKDNLVSAAPAGENESALKEAGKQLGVNESTLDTGLAALGAKAGAQEGSAKDKGVGVAAVTAAAALAAGKAAVAQVLGKGADSAGEEVPAAEPRSSPSVVVSGAATAVKVAAATAGSSVKSALGLGEESQAGTVRAAPEEGLVSQDSFQLAAAEAGRSTALAEAPKGESETEEKKSVAAPSATSDVAPPELAKDTSVSGSSPSNMEVALKQAAGELGIDSARVDAGLATLGAKPDAAAAEEKTLTGKVAGVAAVASTAAVAAATTAAASVGSMLGFTKTDSAEVSKGSSAEVSSSLLPSEDALKESAAKVGVSDQTVDTGLAALGVKKDPTAEESSLTRKAASVAAVVGATGVAGAVAVASSLKKDPKPESEGPILPTTTDEVLQSGLTVRAKNAETGEGVSQALAPGSATRRGSTSPRSVPRPPSPRLHPHRAPPPPPVAQKVVASEAALTAAEAPKVGVEEPKAELTTVTGAKAARTGPAAVATEAVKAEPVVKTTEAEPAAMETEAEPAAVVKEAQPAATATKGEPALTMEAAAPKAGTAAAKSAEAELVTPSLPSPGSKQREENAEVAGTLLAGAAGANGSRAHALSGATEPPSSPATTTLIKLLPQDDYKATTPVTTPRATGSTPTTPTGTPRAVSARTLGRQSSGENKVPGGGLRVDGSEGGEGKEDSVGVTPRTVLEPIPSPLERPPRSSPLPTPPRSPSLESVRRIPPRSPSLDNLSRAEARDDEGGLQTAAFYFSPKGRASPRGGTVSSSFDDARFGYAAAKSPRGATGEELVTPPRSPLGAAKPGVASFGREGVEEKEAKKSGATAEVQPAPVTSEFIVPLTKTEGDAGAVTKFVPATEPATETSKAEVKAQAPSGEVQEESKMKTATAAVTKQATKQATTAKKSRGFCACFSPKVSE